MRTKCTIRCSRCGTSLEINLGSYLPLTDANYGGYVETELPMRCPACLHLLNATAEAFRAQVEWSGVWESRKKETENARMFGIFRIFEKPII